MTDTLRPRIHAPEELETDRLRLVRSKDARDKSDLVSHIFDGTLADDPKDTVTTWCGDLNVPSYKLIREIGFEGPGLDEEGLEEDDDDPVGYLQKYKVSAAGLKNT